MGGNAKYKGARMRTATVGNTEANRQAVKDKNGNIIRVAEGRQVGRGKRTNTTATNARERMINGQAVEQIRSAARRNREFDRQVTKMILEGGVDIPNERFTQADNDMKFLSQMAKQVDPTIHIRPDGYASNQDIERLLGVKLAGVSL